MGTHIYEALVWLLWQGVKALNVLLKSAKMETWVVRPLVEAVV
jgi:hypothetical protein